MFSSMACANHSYVEMLVMLAAVYTNYSSHIVDAEGIEPVDEFIAGPRAGKLILRFEKVEEKSTKRNYGQ
jgi:hypothetical protein